MKKLPALVAILLPHFVMTPFWYAETYEYSSWLPVCQMFYSGLIGPLVIGIYGNWEIIRKKEPVWEVSIFCLSLAILGVFTGYANWGLSTGYFLKPDGETVMLVIFESTVAVITTGLLLVVGLWKRKRGQSYKLINRTLADSQR